VKTGTRLLSGKRISEYHDRFLQAHKKKGPPVEGAAKECAAAEEKMGLGKKTKQPRQHGARRKLKKSPAPSDTKRGGAGKRENAQSDQHHERLRKCSRFRWLS